MKNRDRAAHDGSACAGCPMAGSAALRRFGLNTDNCDYVVALAGNPNTGKSTVFNALTGLRQHVGNWPGKTVTRSEGAFMVGDRKFKVVDLPGTYSLLSQSADEEVARDFLLFGRPDVTIVVTDATALERNLNLALQVLEITDRAVVAVNLIDEAERRGIRVDARALARDLGVPVVATAARQGRGLTELRTVLADVATGRAGCSPRRVERFGRAVERAITHVTRAVLDAHPGLPNARWVALRLLEGDTSVIREARAGTLGEGAHGHTVLATAQGSPTAA